MKPGNILFGSLVIVGCAAAGASVSSRPPEEKRGPVSVPIHVRQRTAMLASSVAALPSMSRMGYPIAVYQGDALAPAQTHAVCPRCGENMGIGVTVVVGPVVLRGMCARCLLDTR